MPSRTPKPFTPFTDEWLLAQTEDPHGRAAHGRRRRGDVPTTAGLVRPEHYREVVNRDDAEGLQYHVLPTDDPLRALNHLREAAGLQPLSDEHDDQGG
jgi:hypothetical protein